MFTQITPVVKNFMIIMVLVFLAQIVMPKYEISPNFLYLHYPDNPHFGIWQLITHMFAHGSFTHLLFNGLGLISIGSFIEEYIGSKRFLILFFVSGLGSAFLQLFMTGVELNHYFHSFFPISNGVPFQLAATPPMLGASGAVYGILASFAFLFPNQSLIFLFIPYPIKAKYLVPIMIGLDLILGISNFEQDPVAHYAHVGGAVFGFLLCYFWVKMIKKRNR